MKKSLKTRMKTQKEIPWETMKMMIHDEKPWWDELPWRPRKLWKGEQLRNRVEKPGDVLRKPLWEPSWDMRIFEEKENYEDEALWGEKLLRSQYEKLEDVQRNQDDDPGWETMMRYEEL